MDMTETRPLAVSDQLRSALNERIKGGDRAGDIGMQAGIHPSIVSRFYRYGTGLSLTNVDRLARVLGTRLTDPQGFVTRSARLARLREAVSVAIDRGTSATVIATKARINQSTLSRFLRGQTGLSPRTFDRLARAVGLDLANCKASV